jgi:transketolase
MRNTFINWLCDAARSDDRIILITADLGYSVIEPFANEYPDRFINVGVAEQNMVGIAAGLASEGLRPYTYSIGIFPTFRCAEQLRNDVDYHNLPVCSCTVGSGVAYGALGYSHHAIQDLALMRSLPKTIIATPADPVEVKATLNWHFDSQSPMYLRMHKSGEPSLHEKDLLINPGVPIRIFGPGNAETCVITHGFLATSALVIIKEANKNIDVYTLPLWGGTGSRDKICKLVNQYKSAITIEDHLLSGGMSSWILESLALNKSQTNIKPICISEDQVGMVASENALLSSVLLSLKNALMNAKV